MCVQLSNPTNSEDTDSAGIWTYHLHVSGPALGRSLHQDDVTTSMWQASIPQDSSGDFIYMTFWERQTIGMGNINVAKGWGQGRGLTGKGHKGTFWGDGNTMS